MGMKYIMKRDNIEETEINEILDNMTKSKAFNGYPYPLNSLSNREFEILLYHIFREKIEHSVTNKTSGENNNNFFTALMCAKHKV